MKSIKTPKNTEALENLRNQGFKITIKHFRKVSWVESVSVVKEDIVHDSVWRSPPSHWEVFQVDECGGATEMTLVRGNQTIDIRTNCYWKDHFCRRLGVKACLDILNDVYKL